MKALIAAVVAGGCKTEIFYCLEGVRTVADIKRPRLMSNFSLSSEALVAECHKHEAYADVVLSKIK
jgi:hypothetical protein